jgi:regulator of protease activity HflC (stomatin/prohibitin superfamily)
MRKTLTLLALTATLSLIGCTRIGPGHVGIKIDNAGSNKGVLDTPVRTGWVFYNPISSSVIEYPTFVQTIQWTRSTSEGNPVNEEIVFTNNQKMVISADVSLSYSLVADKVPQFYVQFKTDDLETFTNNFLHNVARDCFNEHGGHYTIDQIMGDNGPFLKDVRDCLQGNVSNIGVNIVQFGFIGAPRPPANVLAQINASAEAAQLTIQKQNELAQVQADAAKQIAAAEGQAKATVARAQGVAQANQIVAASITANILEKQRLDNQHDAISRWNGKMPDTMAGSGGNFLMEIPK